MQQRQKGSRGKQTQTSTEKANLGESSLFLNIGYTALGCRLHPVVVFSILDHFVRRNEGQTRVYGTLLGHNNDGVVEIKNSFAVPHSEGDKVGFAQEFHKYTHERHLRANPQEMVVGWYATGDTINEDSILIHDFYWREMNAPPIHLLIDTGLKNDKMSINAYTSSPLSLTNQENVLGFQFKPIQVDFNSEKPEKIGMDILLKQNKEDTLLSELDNLELSLERLLSLLDIAAAYVQRVLKGEETPDPKIGRALAETISALPKIDSPQFQKMFSKSMKDLLMVVYLANLTQTQLKISDSFTKQL